MPKLRLNREEFKIFLYMHGLSYEAFARRAGLSLSMVQSVVGGRRNPGNKFIRGLVKAGVPPHEIGKFIQVEKEDGDDEANYIIII